MTSPSLAAYLHFEGADSFSRIDFDRREIRKGFHQAGRLVQKKARFLTGHSRSAIEQDGYPNRRTGRLSRSIKSHVNRSSFMVRIMPHATSGSEFYPAYLHYGVKNGSAWRIEPRKNFMQDALASSNRRIIEILEQVFANSLS